MKTRILFIVAAILLGAFLLITGARALTTSGGQGGPNTTPTPEPTPTVFGDVVFLPAVLYSGQLASAPPPPTSISRATPTPEPTGAVQGTPVPSPVPTVIIQAEWPPKMDVGFSDTVSVSLIKTTKAYYTIDIERQGQTAVPATLVPRGTPDVPYPNAYGPDYDLISATAILSSTNIDVVPVGNMTQSNPLDENTLKWQWNISPTKAGKQVLTASVIFRWEPRNGRTGPPKEYAIWQHTLDIDVTEPGPVTLQPAGDASSASPSASSQSSEQPLRLDVVANALQVLTGAGAVVAFLAGAFRWGRGKAKARTDKPAQPGE